MVQEPSAGMPCAVDVTLRFARRCRVGELCNPIYQALLGALQRHFT
jgi:hypothetical protein